MSLKETIENNAPVILFGTLLAGFLAGIGTMSFLESREKEQREQIEAREKTQRELLVAQLQTKNHELEATKEELLKEVKGVLVQYVDQVVADKTRAASVDARNGKPIASNQVITPDQRAIAVEHIQGADHAEIARIILDPMRRLGLHF